jgi:hypothetical protein
MTSQDRLTYETLKFYALDAYFDGCRDHGIGKGWTQEQIIGFVSYTFEDGFSLPIENLMWDVILLVLCGDWYPQWNESGRKDIENQIQLSGLENLLVDVPQEEIDLFTHDLRILKFLS